MNKKTIALDFNTIKLRFVDGGDGPNNIEIKITGLSNSIPKQGNDNKAVSGILHTCYTEFYFDGEKYTDLILETIDIKDEEGKIIKTHTYTINGVMKKFTPCLMMKKSVHPEFVNFVDAFDNKANEAYIEFIKTNSILSGKKIVLDKKGFVKNILSNDASGKIFEDPNFIVKFKATNPEKYIYSCNFDVCLNDTISPMTSGRKLDENTAKILYEKDQLKDIREYHFNRIIEENGKLIEEPFTLEEIIEKIKNKEKLFDPIRDVDLGEKLKAGMNIKYMALALNNGIMISNTSHVNADLVPRYLSIEPAKKESKSAEVNSFRQNIIRNNNNIIVKKVNKEAEKAIENFEELNNNGVPKSDENY